MSPLEQRLRARLERVRIGAQLAREQLPSQATMANCFIEAAALVEGALRGDPEGRKALDAAVAPLFTRSDALRRQEAALESRAATLDDEAKFLEHMLEELARFEATLAEEDAPPDSAAPVSSIEATSAAE